MRTHRWWDYRGLLGPRLQPCLGISRKPCVDHPCKDGVAACLRDKRLQTPYTGTNGGLRIVGLLKVLMLVSPEV